MAKLKWVKSAELRAAYMQPERLIPAYRPES